MTLTRTCCALAACASLLKLTIGANLVAFVNAALRVEYKKLEQCFALRCRQPATVRALTTALRLPQ